MSDDLLYSLIGSILIALISAIPGLRALRIQDESRRDTKEQKSEEITDRIITRANNYINELEEINQELKIENRYLVKWKVKALEYILNLYRAAIKNEWILIENKLPGSAIPDLPEWFLNDQESNHGHHATKTK